MNEKCEMCKHETNAFSECIWGLYGIHSAEQFNNAILCASHTDELWSRIQGAVNSGLMHFQVRALNV